MNLEPVEAYLVSRWRGGVLKGLGQQIGSIHSHAGRHRVAEKRCQNEVQFMRLTDALQAGIAESESLAFSGGRDRDL